MTVTQGMVRYVCKGRLRGRLGDPLPGDEGGECGREFEAQPGPCVSDPETQARAAGWRIGPTADDQDPDVMCPRCARPVGKQ